jgi:hypothetical protein
MQISQINKNQQPQKGTKSTKGNTKQPILYLQPAHPRN